MAALCHTLFVLRISGWGQNYTHPIIKYDSRQDRCLPTSFDQGDEMPCSSVSRYTDINDFRHALQQTNSEIVITGAGCFSARIVTIDLPRLRLQRVDETLARAGHVQMADPQMAIGFSASPGQPMRCQGFVLGSDD